MSISNKSRTAGAVLFSLTLLAARADAAIITVDPNSSMNIELLWSQLVAGTELRATGTAEVTVTDTYADFLIAITNETELWNERVHSIGFNTSPNGTSLTNTQAGVYFGGFGLNTTFPSFQRVDICAWSSGNCSGGPQGANLPGFGTSDTFGFRLMGNFTEGLQVGSFAIQFMGDLGSYQFENIPEPGSLLLVGIGIAGAVIRRRSFVR